MTNTRILREASYDAATRALAPCRCGAPAVGDNPDGLGGWHGARCTKCGTRSSYEAWPKRTEQTELDLVAGER